MKKTILFITCVFLSTIVFAQRKSNKSVLPEYNELPNPGSADKKDWENLPVDVTVTFANAGSRYAKNKVPSIVSGKKEWNTTAWKGEKVHTQLLIYTKKLLQQVTIKAGALKNEQGAVIPAKNVTTGFVRYVLTDGLNKEGSGCGIAPRNESDSSLSADVIDYTAAKSIEAFTTQPVWLSISIPQNTSAGLYNGTLTVNASGKDTTLAYTIKVQDRVLPLPQYWKYHLDLWQNPYAIARWYKVKPWSPEHLNAMKPYMQMLANAGQKAITVSMIHDPWRGQTYDIYQSMIKWTKGKDGTWKYDYAVFDKWVNFMQSLGINKVINCYSMVPWNNKFYYYDETIGKDTLLIAKTGTPEYEAHWKPMLIDFVKHLKQKGWFEKTAIAMDERPMEDMQKVIALVRSVDRDFKVSLAGSYHSSLAHEVYDYCVGSGDVASFDPSAVQQRTQAGLTTTYYTCCAEGYPNTFTFSPPSEAAWLGWFAANKNLNGYLRWAYNCWPENPLQDSRYRGWSAGDTYLVYPGPRSSVRFERMIEGIQDYEKIQILKDEFNRKNQADKLQELNDALKPFELNALKQHDAEEMLQKAKTILNNF